MAGHNAPDGLDEVIDRYHEALSEFVRGDNEPILRCFSEREDVTLGNPFGPFVRGQPQIAEATGRAAAFYRDGEATGFDTISKVVTADLAYIVELQHFLAKVGGRDDVVPVTLRVTSIFRPEDGRWKLAHRHADPITSARPAESVITEEQRKSG
jgi:ketosteroid isomerase-like protein